MALAWADRGVRFFTRPAPVAAMLLVAANDHLLKGAGLLPPWLTGKLSDFAGLYFAPLLLAEIACLLALLGPHRRSRELPPLSALRAAHPNAALPTAEAAVLALACALVGVAFAALKLSPSAAGLYDATTSRLFGFVARTTTDPSDLIALPMVVVAFLDGRRIAVRSAQKLRRIA